MPRIPKAELDRLKLEISLERLAVARGVKLTRKGKDLHGRCPFHDDRTPSLVIDTAKNLWHCFGACNAGGSVVDWVMRERGVSVRHAIELLRNDLPGFLEAGPVTPVKVGTVRTLPPVVTRTADELTLLAQVVGYYHKRLPLTAGALDYLRRRGLEHPEMIEHFQIGFSDRTLGLTIPPKNRKEGAEIRQRLETLGLYNALTGHELYRGMLTIPTFDENSQIVGLYGRRITDTIPKEERHKNLLGPLRGLLNGSALVASDEIILCEAPLDLLTFWCAGYRNVTCSFGTQGFTDEHRAALKSYGTKRVLIAYDRDSAGDSAAAKLTAELTAAGIDCYRILFPHDMDANEYALKVRPAAKSLDILIRKAEWLGNGRRPEREPGRAAAPLETVSAMSPAAAPTAPRMADELPGQLSLFAAELPGQASQTTLQPELTAQATKEKNPAAAAASTSAVESTELLQLSEEPPTPLTPDSGERPPPAASPLPPAPRPPPAATLDRATDTVTLTRGDRLYRVRGLEKNTSFAILRVNLRVRSDHGFHVDTLDLLQARARAAFEKAASLELGCAEAVIHDDMAVLLNALDELQGDAMRKLLEPKDSKPTISEEERAEALALLRDPQLVDRLLVDFERAGVVGEETNKLIGYLATVSRKLKKPLALIVQSTSAAGKSTLMDAILDFVPTEDRVQFSALTGQALFYMGETNLAHKILAIVEEEGAERASYALKLLQSEGKLNIASTGKDPTTGKLVTHEYHVQGPVMIFLTTTASDLDDELQNRCLILAVNEDRAQTQKIHQLQRVAHTLVGLVAEVERSQILSRHQNAQRLLSTLAVENPFVHRLSFPDDKTRTRRDHAKYLNLIDTIALLHQHQRPILTHQTPTGKTLRYIRVTAADIRLANRLADEVLGRSLDELPPQTRKLLQLVDALVSRAATEMQCDRRDYRFTRRQVREATGWGNTQLKLHLARLEDFEYLATHRSGHGLSFVYELRYDGRGADGKPFLSGLIDPDAPVADAGAASSDTPTTPRWSGQTPGWSGLEGERSAPGRAEVGPKSGGGRTQENPGAESVPAVKPLETAENAHLEHPSKIVPYRQPAPGRGQPARTHRMPAPPAANAAKTAAGGGPGRGNGRSHPKRAARS